jgi:O-antigen/teichoic acid export membrane protein
VPALEPHAARTTHIRGSSLLLLGRLLGVGLNFLIQVLTVRYLTKSDYGAFAYALSAEALGASLAAFCLDKSLARFMPIYHERRDYRRIFGRTRPAR